ncbi:hypothetical protein A5789_33050 [Nocardia sp. 852002-51101_SCH5132738]|nr:hypothetical protein A5789_33050 [Nocardia sp. 852002-51101_SCH5132738]OBB43524.1 hypothetical protein A5748_28515 [Nocardia sp. 852002-51244_SCH5132740]OBF65422.1 hypothetical protein A9X06_07615 [Mycobacterium sp. 852002-51759_SCH5129042]
MPYLDFLAPGIIAQSALFIAIFYGIQLIWDGDAVSHVNPLSYEVDALRGLLVGGTADLWTDFGVLVLAALLGIACASALLGRLTR